MKPLLMKIALLLSPFAVLALAVVANVERSTTLRDGVYSPELEGKIRTFLTADTDVIIGGDSRAERQVVPAIVALRTGRRTVNIATAACDLVTLHNAFKRHGFLSGDRALIVSASLFQVSDGAIEPGYLSTASVLHMTLREKVALHKDALRSLLVDLVKVSFRRTEGRPAVITDGRLREHGFLGVEGSLPLPVKILLDPEKTNHPWYRNLSLHGARWRVFREALDRLSASRLRIYIYQPPVSPAWRAYTAGTFIDRGEREFGGMLRAATRGYPNVRFLDFYSDPDARLGNGMYYDIQHLNRAGAAKFTEILLERVGDDLRAGRMAPSEDSAELPRPPP